MSYDIAFLHTHAQHIDTFDQLVKQRNPKLHVRHIVDESLLVQVRKEGESDALQASLDAVLADAAASAQLVVVSCSSIGALAERSSVLEASRVMRVDRAMADAAVCGGPRILLLAALDSALSAAVGLLQQSAADLGQSPQISANLVPEAWGYFEAGDDKRYASSIARSIDMLADQYDVVVLSQASMESAIALSRARQPILTSPVIGVEAALDKLNTMLATG